MQIPSVKKDLEDAKLKLTRSRIAILEILKSEKRPLDVSEIILYLEKLKVETDQATVYRSLNAFYEKGLIKRFELQEGKFRYEMSGNDHHHLICENCGRIEDISDCNLDSLENEITRKKKFVVKRHALEFFGLCERCAKKLT